jgi:hypothetical protein
MATSLDVSVSGLGYDSNGDEELAEEGRCDPEVCGISLKA